MLWAHHAPILNQGDLGACTGFSTAQLINTDYFAAARHGGGYLGSADAIELYSEATRQDGIPGNTYPPNDCGSSGLGVAKAGKKLGYFTGYKHAFGFDHFAEALQLQPVIVGTQWLEGMFDTDPQGFVKPVGKPAGGHEYLALGISYETQTITFLNAWGPSWGRDGRFLMTFKQFAKLLADQGDVTAPLPKATS